MKTSLYPRIFGSITFACFATSLSHADIIIHGNSSDYTETSGDWLSLGDNDIDGNGSLGTDGYILFGDFDGTTNNNQPYTSNVTSLPGYVSAHSDDDTDFISIAFGFDGYGEIDGPLELNGDDRSAGIAVSALPNAARAAGASVSIMNFTISGLSAEQVVRVGVLCAVEPNTDGRWDPTSITLSDGVSSATVGDHDLTPLSADAGGNNVGWIFFDIDAEGTYTVSGTQRLNTQGASIGGLVFDSIGGDGDADGLLDAWEIQNFGNLDQIGTDDPDMDGLPNLDEQTVFTDPNEPDSDGDGDNDGFEVNDRGTLPLNPDSDDDGILDGNEKGADGVIEEEGDLLTDPLNSDSDGDTFDDGLEVTFGSDPTDVASIPDTITSGYAEASSDWITAGANDIDGSGGLGSHGFIFFGNIGNGAGFDNNVAFLPDYITSLSEGGQFTNVSGAHNGSLIDDPNVLDGTDVVVGSLNAGFVAAGIGDSSELMVFEVSGLAVDQVVRVGVLAGVQNTPAQNPGSITLSNESGPVGRAVDLPNQQGFVFFDIDSDGVYSLTATQIQTSGGVSIGGLTFDSTGPGGADIPFPAPDVPLKITAIDYDLSTEMVTLTWDSRDNIIYAILFSSDLQDFDAEADDGIMSGGATTTHSFPNPQVGEPRLFFRVIETPTE